jgi:murein DD-endopeptidase MepM/ murein hydrolase activator NlpD
VQVQFHPASGGGAVRTLSLGDREQTVLAGVVAVLAGLAVSLWFTVPAMLQRAEREEARTSSIEDAGRLKSETEAVRRTASGLRFRARRSADLLNRVAFLYRFPAAEWPNVLGPDHPLLGDDDPARVAAGLPLFLRALERGRALAQQRESEDTANFRESPAILPLGAGAFEPSAYFGPRRSPWTNEEEFLTGVEIASPAGTPVVAPADGTVVFAGTVRRSVGGRFWELGNVVVLSHAQRGATVFGHLSRIDVRRGQRLTRGTRLGAVGATGWALSPELHYEYWRPDGTGLRPTDPLFAVLDQALSRQPSSLAQMDATWAPGPLDPLPGISVGAEEAAGSRAPPKTRRLKRRNL